MSAGARETDAATRDAARRAFDAYAHAFETGDPSRLLDLVTGDVGFMATVPEAGRKARSGKDEVGDLARWRWDELRLRPSVVLDGVTEGGRTAGFEYRLEGTLGGEPYKTHAIVFFDVSENGRATGFREYYGDNITPPEAFREAGLEEVFTEETPGLAARTAGKPPTLATTERLPAPDRVLDVGQRAFEAFRLSCEEGDWGPYLDLMYEWVSFTLPIPGRMRGKKQGIPEVAEYHRWRWEDLRMRFDSFEQRGVTANGETFTTEFRVEGTIGEGMGYKHPAVYVFDVRGEKVVGFREYNGDEEDAAEET